MRARNSEREMRAKCMQHICNTFCTYIVHGKQYTPQHTCLPNRLLIDECCKLTASAAMDIASLIAFPRTPECRSALREFD